MIRMQELNAIDCESFYQQRDHRTNLTLSQPPFASLLAVSVSPQWAETVNGQLTLYWLSSLISRMGRRYNQLMLFLPNGIAGIHCLILGHHGTFSEVILSHLRASDPCGDYRVVNELRGDIPLISVGKLERTFEHIVIEPHGWSAVINSSGASPISATANTWFNPIGAALAASLGATEVYFQFNRESLAARESQLPLWISARHCAVTAAADEAAKWNDDIPIPDNIDIGRWLVIGAGALGGNALAILGMARQKLKGSIEIVEPDVVDLTNLNRLVESLATHVGLLKKVDLAANSFRESNVEVVPHDTPYEHLRNTGRFRIEHFDLVMTGVDQMATRAFVQSDWPRFLIDGGTRGYTWRVSTMGNRGDGPCLGCLAGKSQQHYRDLASPLRCAIGLPGQAPTIATPMDSYSFVSFFAATFMAARAIEKYLETSPATVSSFRTEAVARNLRQLQHKQEVPSQSCLCLCSHPVVRAYREAKFSGHA
jgi:molybdopterin/thiamine biosynthesis adenylyltransferase